MKIEYSKKMNAVSTPNWEMTADTLWMVWTKADLSLVKAGIEGPVSQDWAIASEGQAGLDEIRPSAGDIFIAAAPLVDLRAAMSAMNKMERGFLKKASDRWLPFALSTYVVLVKFSEQEWRWIPVRARTDQEAMRVGEEFGRVVASGKFDDLAKTVDEGDKILTKKDYGKVLMDLRPVRPGHPKSWLMQKRSPSTAARLASLIGEEHVAS